jgi:hypothetical protein
LCHGFLLKLVWAGENALQGNAEAQGQEGLHVQMSLAPAHIAYSIRGKSYEVRCTSIGTAKGGVVNCP